MEKVKRFYYIDFLKVIGLLCVILAHVNPPEWLRLVRSFDVPLLVLVSASLSWLTYREENYISYIWKRIKRLVFPTWLYLCFCLGFFLISKTMSVKDIVPAFLFQKYAFGHTWIILLYLVVALIIPLLRRLNFTKWQYVLCFILFVVGYEFLCIKTNLYSYKIFEYTLFYVIPYGFISYMGIFAVKCEKKFLPIISVVSLLICVIFFILYYCKGSIQYWIDFNQPARLYYLSYGLAVSFFLYLIFRDKEYRIFNNIIVRFLSQHSLWIYLWHSFWCFICIHFVKNWALLYVMIVSLSVFTVFLQYRIVKFIKGKTHKIDNFINLFLG